jgi:hypothetical protein
MVITAINILLVLLTIPVAASHFPENGAHEVYSLFPNDTIIREDIDASDLILAYRFQYVDKDTAASKRLLDAQVAFLKKMHLPSSGFEEVAISQRFDFDALIKDYNKKLIGLRGNPFKDLYRQASSQMLVKYLCSGNNIGSYSKISRHNKLLFFLEEMKDSGGTNISLVYTSFLKFQYESKHRDLCERLNVFIPYCDIRLKECQNEYDEIQVSYREDSNPFNKLMVDLSKQSLDANLEYVAKLKYMKGIVCH